jgi:hypothetical protein
LSGFFFLAQHLMVDMPGVIRCQGSEGESLAILLQGFNEISDRGKVVILEGVFLFLRMGFEVFGNH